MHFERRDFMPDTIAQMIGKLCSLYGVSGREETVGRAAAEMLRAFVPDAAWRDGSVYAHMGNDPQKPTLLFCAHLDQVGFLVTDITEDGFLRIGAVGGIDNRLLLGQQVKVVCKTQILDGVISILPPHVLSGEQAVPEDGQLCVDVGFASASELEGILLRGDAVHFATAPKMLLNGMMTAPALDDRCCVAALIRTAELLSACENLRCNVVFVLGGQEERGGRGAKLAAEICKPDYAIAVDVTFGMAHGEDPTECMELGKGPAIGISSVLSPELSDALIHTAVNEEIPYQLEVMPHATGTDADALALAPNGCAAGTVSVPLRNMHTPVEVICLEDIEKTAQLLAKYAERCGNV